MTREFYLSTMEACAFCGIKIIPNHNHTLIKNLDTGIFHYVHKRCLDD